MGGAPLFENEKKDGKSCKNYKFSWTGDSAFSTLDPGIVED